MSTHGYVTYKPKDFATSVLKASRQVLIEYEAWESPFTVRQVFYRLVAEYHYEKTEAAYSSLGNFIARSRRAFQHRVFEEIRDGKSAQEARDAAVDDGILIPFDWIRDEKGQSSAPYFQESAEEFVDGMKAASQGFELDRQEGQSTRLELWCEANGTLPVISEVGDPYSVRTSSGGGYDSVTAKHELAKRIVRTWAESQVRTAVLHIGDFDPSGEGMFQTLDDDVTEMVRQFTGSYQVVTFHRIALREDQVIDMEIETAPPKPSDSRSEAFILDHPDAVEHFGSEDISAQLEALVPSQIRELVETAIIERVDEDVRQEVLDREIEIRETLREALEDVELP